MTQRYDFVPKVPLELDLAPADYFLPQLLWSKRILIFSHSETLATHHEVVSIFQQGLQATLDAVPFLAGKLVPSPDEPGKQKSRRRIVHGGAVRLIVKDLSDRLDFEKLNASDFSSELLHPDDLVPIEKYQMWGEQAPLCYMQLSFIRGGLCITVCITHIASDGRGITTVLHTLAENCRRISAARTNGGLLKPVRLPDGSLDRSMLNRPPGGNINNHPSYAVLDKMSTAPPDWADQVPSVSRVFRISAANSVALKRLASQRPSADVAAQPYITTHDALIALMWRTITVCRIAVGKVTAVDKSTALILPVEFRSSARPQLPKTFIGNAVYPAQSVLALADMTNWDHGIANAAHTIRGTMNSVTPSLTDDWLGMCAGLSDVRLLSARSENLRGRQILVTSYRNFDHIGMPWPREMGKYEAFRLPAGGIANGVPIVLPLMPDGSLEVALTLDEDVMGLFEQDEVLRRYVEVV